MAKAHLPLPKAQGLSERIVAALRPASARIEVAGSIRRHRPEVGDIEAVVIPRRGGGLFADEDGPSLLDGLLHDLVQAGRLRMGRLNGDRFKQFEIPACPGLTLDLFIVTPATWGVQLAIRTGAAEFSKALVTERSRGGLLQDGLIVRSGRVWRRDQVVVGMIDWSGSLKRESGPFFQPLPGAVPLDTPEEQDFLGLCGGWVDPQARGQLQPAEAAR
jgi:hypothetical protein